MDEQAYYADTVNTFEPTTSESLLLDKFVQTFASALLHALKAKAHVYREFEAEHLVGLEDVEPAEDRALIVCRTTPNQPAGLLVDDKREGLRVPSVALLCLQ